MHAKVQTACFVNLPEPLDNLSFNWTSPHSMGPSMIATPLHDQKFCGRQSWAEVSCGNRLVEIQKPWPVKTLKVKTQRLLWKARSSEPKSETNRNRSRNSSHWRCWNRHDSRPAENEPNLKSKLPRRLELKLPTQRAETWRLQAWFWGAISGFWSTRLTIHPNKKGEGTCDPRGTRGQVPDNPTNLPKGAQLQTVSEVKPRRLHFSNSAEDLTWSKRKLMKNGSRVNPSCTIRKKSLCLQHVIWLGVPFYQISPQKHQVWSCSVLLPINLIGDLRRDLFWRSCKNNTKTPSLSKDWDFRSEYSLYFRWCFSHWWQIGSIFLALVSPHDV